MATRADTIKLEKLFGFKPKVSLREGLTREWEWMQKFVQSEDDENAIKANVQPTQITTDQAKLPVEEGDFIERALPNGNLETYLVMDRGFYSRFGGVPDHYQMKVRKESAIDSARKSAAQIYTISSSPNARITMVTSTSIISAPR